MAKRKQVTSLVPVERIERSILFIREHKVMLDSDLAALYEVKTAMLTRAVKPNIERFPEDFMFQLSQGEFDILRCQFGTSSQWGGRRYPPYAFTGPPFGRCPSVAMLSSVLRSLRAVQVNIEIMRAFVRLRQLVASHDQPSVGARLARKLAALERKYDQQFKVVFDFSVRPIHNLPVVGPGSSGPSRRYGDERAQTDAGNRFSRHSGGVLRS